MKSSPCCAHYGQTDRYTIDVVFHLTFILNISDSVSPCCSYCCCWWVNRPSTMTTTLSRTRAARSETPPEVCAAQRACGILLPAGVEWTTWTSAAPASHSGLKQRARARGEPLDRPPCDRVTNRPALPERVRYSSLRLRDGEGGKGSQETPPCIVCVSQGELGGNGFISVQQQQLWFRSGNQNSLRGADSYSSSVAGECPPARKTRRFVFFCPPPPPEPTGGLL